MADTVAWDALSVVRMIEERRLDEAAKRVSEVLDRQPSHLPARIARVRLLIASERMDEALQLAERLSERHPKNLWVAGVTVDALIGVGRLEDARALFLSLLPPPSQDAPVAAMLKALLSAEGDAGERIAFVRQALEAWPDSQLLNLKLAALAYAAARPLDALGHLETAQSLGPLPPYAKDMKDTLAGLMDDRDEAIRYLTERVDEPPHSLDAMRHLIHLLAISGRFEEAGERVVEALERWPGNWRIAYRANATYLDNARSTEVFEAMKAAAGAGAAGAAGDLFLFQFAQIALRIGRDDVALALLSRLAAGAVTRHFSEPMLHALRAAQGLAEGPSRVGADRAKDVEVVSVDGARATLVVFGSLTGGIGHLPFHVLDPVLARLGVNIVYLRDPYGAVYLNGVPSLGEDEAATAAALARIVEDLGAERVVTMGTSISGYVAARYGLAIGADAALSFAGPIALKSGASPTRPIATAFAQLQKATRGAHDLTAALVDAGDRFRLSIVVGAEGGPDGAWAAEAGALDNVDLVPLAGVAHHFVAHASLASGRFLPILQSVIDPAATR